MTNSPQTKYHVSLYYENTKELGDGGAVATGAQSASYVVNDSDDEAANDNQSHLSFDEEDDENMSENEYNKSRSSSSNSDAQSAPATPAFATLRTPSPGNGTPYNLRRRSPIQYVTPSIREYNYGSSSKKRKRAYVADSDSSDDDDDPKNDAAFSPQNASPYSEEEDDDRFEEEEDDDDDFEESPRPAKRKKRTTQRRRRSRLHSPSELEAERIGEDVEDNEGDSDDDTDDEAAVDIPRREPAERGAHFVNPIRHARKKRAYPKPTPQKPRTKFDDGDYRMITEYLERRLGPQHFVERRGVRRYIWEDCLRELYPNGTTHTWNTTSKFWYKRIDEYIARQTPEIFQATISGRRRQSQSDDDDGEQDADGEQEEPEESDGEPASARRPSTSSVYPYPLREADEPEAARGVQGSAGESADATSSDALRRDDGGDEYEEEPHDSYEESNDDKEDEENMDKMSYEKDMDPMLIDDYDAEMVDTDKGELIELEFEDDNIVPVVQQRAVSADPSEGIAPKEATQEQHADSSIYLQTSQTSIDFARSTQSPIGPSYIATQTVAPGSNRTSLADLIIYPAFNNEDVEMDEDSDNLSVESEDLGASSSQHSSRRRLSYRSRLEEEEEDVATPYRVASQTRDNSAIQQESYPAAYPIYSYVPMLIVTPPRPGTLDDVEEEEIEGYIAAASYQSRSTATPVVEVPVPQSEDDADEIIYPSRSNASQQNRSGVAATATAAAPPALASHPRVLQSIDIEISEEHSRVMEQKTKEARAELEACKTKNVPPQVLEAIRRRLAEKQAASASATSNRAPSQKYRQQDYYQVSSLRQEQGASNANAPLPAPAAAPSPSPAVAQPQSAASGFGPNTPAGIALRLEHQYGLPREEIIRLIWTASGDLQLVELLLRGEIDSDDNRLWFNLNDHNILANGVSSTYQIYELIRRRGSEAVERRIWWIDNHIRKWKDRSGKG